MPCCLYSYGVNCRQQVDHASRDRKSWTRKSTLNVVHVGKFLSDRAIREYSQEIWKVVPVKLESQSRP
ncbi:MAG: glycogen/starch/alpha-glucan phosphorylase [Desulfobacterales bacterium]